MEREKENKEEKKEKGAICVAILNRMILWDDTEHGLRSFRTGKRKVAVGEEWMVIRESRCGFWINCIGTFYGTVHCVCRTTRDNF